MRDLLKVSGEELSGGGSVQVRFFSRWNLSDRELPGGEGGTRTIRMGILSVGELSGGNLPVTTFTYSCRPPSILT